MTARRVALRAASVGVASGAATLIVLVALTAPVGGHGDEGLLRVVGIQVASDEYQVRITVDYAYDDEHAVYRDGILRLSGRSSDGVTLIPETFSRTEVDGRYAVDVVLPPPGVWTLRIDGTSPVAATEVRIDSAAPEWLEPDAAPTGAGSEHSGPHVRWDWMFAGLSAVAGWFMFVRWRRRTSRQTVSDAP